MTINQPQRPAPRVDPFAVPYWEALRRGEFVLPRDVTTGEFLSPTRAVPGVEVEWVPAARGGHIVSYSWVYLQPMDGYATQLPYVLATVRLDDGPQMMCNIIDPVPEKVTIDRRVELVLEALANGVVVPQFRVA